MRKWAYDSNVLLHWLVRLLPTAWGGAALGGGAPPAVSRPGQLLWAVLAGVWGGVFWVAGC